MSYEYSEEQPYAESRSGGEESDGQEYHLFEDARRQQVLRDIGQFQNEPAEREILQPHEQLEEILNKQKKRRLLKEQRINQNQLKKLRQKDSTEFFRKIKAIVIEQFRQSISTTYQALSYSENKLEKLLSFCSIQTIMQFQQLRIRKNIKRENFVKVIQTILQSKQLELNDQHKLLAIWGMALHLGVQFRKVQLIDISNLDLETFYNLKYKEQGNKRKKVQKQLDKLRNKIQRQASEDSMRGQTFKSIDSYGFNVEEVPMQRTQDTVPKVNYTHSKSLCQVYCPIEQDWQYYLLQQMQPIALEQIKMNILQNRSVIGFYGCRRLKFRPQFQSLSALRTFGEVQFEDLTRQLSDKQELAEKRRNRLGCRHLYRQIMQESKIAKSLSVFSPQDEKLISALRQQNYHYALDNFPKNTREMKYSQYFVIPSLVDKYMYLSEDAIPLEGRQFHEQRVYLKRDLLQVSSKRGWIDKQRMVRQGEAPVKVTENKNKGKTELFVFSQTEPFRLRLDQQSNFILDEQYNNIYVPKKFEIPEGYCLVKAKCENICKKNGFKYAQIVQGFDVAGMHIVPNNIGYLIKLENQQEVQRLVKEREQRMLENKEEKKKEQIAGLWKKLFKSIIITQQV